MTQERHMPETTHPAASIEFRRVTKRYEGTDSAAVEDLSLEIPAGEICVLVGPSGCGKTTAMRMVNRLIDMTEGDILVDGRSVNERKPAELRREIGYAIQQIGLFPHQTIADNIATVPKLLGWSKDRIRARVDELLELISLDPAEVRSRYPGELSGGQRQRVGVARALAADPPVLLMDEPFGAIDPITRERLQNEFLRLQAEIRKTIVFVTHDIDEAIKMGDKIAVLKKGGHLAQYAAPAELLMRPADPFVEDFVGADRSLKRLALQRVRDIDLWKAALVHAGEPVDEARRRSPTPTSTSRCSSTTRAARRAGSASAPTPASACGPSCARPPVPPSSSTTCCATRSATCSPARSATARSSTPTGCVVGVLSLDTIAHALQVPAEQTRSGADLLVPSGEE
jgi:osmoprotectant transport system ATP-binding protein